MPDLGLPPTNYNPSYGGIPTVPNPVDTASGAIGGNIANWDQIMALANLYNQQAVESSVLPFQTNLPGYAGMMGQQSQNIASQLKGEIPQDVKNLIAQSAAERGIMTGSPMSPNANAAWLRALGLTSIGQQEAGAQGLQRAIGEIPMPKLFDYNSMLVTPEQQQANSLLQSIFSSAPVPQLAAEAAIQAALRGLGGNRTGVGNTALPSRITLPGGTPTGPIDPSTLPWNRQPAPIVAGGPQYPTQGTATTYNPATGRQELSGAGGAGGLYTPSQWLAGAGGTSYPTFQNMLSGYTDMGGGVAPSMEDEMWNYLWSQNAGEPGTTNTYQGDPYAWLYGGTGAATGTGTPSTFDMTMNLFGSNPMDTFLGGGTTATEPWDSWTSQDWTDLEDWLGDSGGGYTDEIGLDPFAGYDTEYGTGGYDQGTSMADDMWNYISTYDTGGGGSYGFDWGDW